MEIFRWKFNAMLLNISFPHWLMKYWQYALKRSDLVTMQYFLLWNCHKILFSYFNISLVISKMPINFLKHEYYFLSVGTVQLWCKGQCLPHGWGRRRLLRSCCLVCLPQLLVAIATTTWFVFPLAQQHLSTKMKGYFGEGFSFNYSCTCRMDP